MKMKTAYMGLLLAFALILSYIEVLIPLPVGIPGIKLGLANLAVVLTIYLLGKKEALMLTITKAIFSGLLFGNLSVILYNLAGAFLSFIGMVIAKKLDKFHIPIVSAIGGVMHNIGQVIIACIMIQSYGVVYYVPILLITGLVTGILIGMIATLLMPYLRKILERGIQI